MNIKRLLSAICCTAVAIGLIKYGGHIVRPIKVDTDIEAVRTFHEMPENSFEVIGYGSSHIYWSLDISEMYNQYGIGAYNYGNDGQSLNTTLLFFKDSLETQRPKVALVETYFFTSVLQNADMGRELYYTRALKNTSYKMEYLRQCFGNNLERWASYFIPLFGLHANWPSVTSAGFKPNRVSGEFAKTMGYFSVGDSMADGIEIISGLEQNPLPDESFPVLDELVKTATENDIQLVFYTTPFHGWYHYGDAVKEYADENGIPYLNLFELFDETGLDTETDFHDKNHVNSCGAIKIADYLGKYLIENYDLTDFREIPGNIWEQAFT